MITKVPNPVLFQKAKTVDPTDKRVKKVIKELKDTLIKTRNPKGVGLAAPQIGVSLRIFVTRAKEREPIRTFLNPEITWVSEEVSEIQRVKITDHPKDDKKLEGCLSIDNIWGHLQRPSKIKLKYTNEDGQTREEAFSGFLATIIQHETDHLEGILFTKRVLEQKEKLYQIEEDEEGEEKLVEIKV